MDLSSCEETSLSEGRIGPAGSTGIEDVSISLLLPRPGPSGLTCSWTLAHLTLVLIMLVVLVSVLLFLFLVLLLADLVYVGIKDNFNPNLNILVIESYTLYGFWVKGNGHI